MSQGVSRRAFSKTAVAPERPRPHASLAPGRVLGANERVRLGFIGVGNRGCQLLKGFLAHPDAQVVALCDVYEPYLYGALSTGSIPASPAWASASPRCRKIEGDVGRVKDFRTVLDRKDIDAVVIATPDHWHAIQMIAACRAGKDVYVEKPLSMTIVEGRAMVDAARKYDRIVQVGIHRRSSRMYRAARRGGALRRDGQGHRGARGLRQQHGARAGSATLPNPPPPAGLDWDLWLGPRPGSAVPGDDHAVQVPLVGPLLVADGQLGRPLLRPDPLADRRAGPGERLGARRAVRRRRRPHHPRYHRGDLRARLGHADRLQHPRGQRPAGAGPRRRGRAAGHDRDRLCQRSTATRSSPSAAVRSRTPSRAARARSSSRPTATSTSRPPATSSTASRAASGPAADIEEGHRSTTFAHLANIALATRKRLEWDPQAERFTHCDEANQLLHYEYRKPWSLA